MTGDGVTNNDSLGDDPEIPNLSISSQISKCVNDCFERAKNVILFTLKEYDNKVQDDKLVESLIIFIIGHNTTFKCTRLGKKEGSVTRPAKIKFHHLSVKNVFMYHLNKLKNAPSEFNKISIKHDMMPNERSKEKELYLKAKDLNNDSSNSSKNKFYVVTGPVWDRQILKVKKKGKIQLRRWN